MYRTQNFFVGFEYPRKKSHQGRIYHLGELFANIYIQGRDWRNDGKEKWILNRDGKAFEMKFEHDEISRNGFDSIQDMLEYLENWVKENA